MQARLKCCDDRFAVNPQYIFHALEWVETNAVENSVHLFERRQFQSEISVDQLVNHGNVRRILSDDQVLSSYKKNQINFTVLSQYAVGYPC